jgi:hypothetical protein
MTIPNSVKWAASALLLAAAFMSGFLISFDTYQMIALGVLAIVLGLVVLSVQMNNHFLGVAVLVATAVAVPIEFGGDGRASPMNTSFFLAALLCVIWLVDLVVLRRAAAPQAGRIHFAAWAFAASAVVSFAIAQLSPSPTGASAPLGAQVAQLLIFLVSIGLFLVAGELIGNLANLERLTWIFLIGGVLICFIAIVPIRVFPLLMQPLVDISHVATVGSAFWTWLAALSLTQAIFNRELGRTARLAAASITALTLFRGLVLAMSWASGWVPPLIAVSIVLFFRFPRLTLVAGGVGAVALLYVAPGMTTFTPDAEQYSAMTRLAAAKVLLPHIQASPVIGSGPANYYYLVASSSILGWYVRFNSHNQYVDIAAQLGAAGIIAFGWLTYEMAVASWRLRTRFRNNFGEAYAIGLFAGLAGTVASGLLADWIFPFYYNIGIGGVRSSILFWVFMSGIFVLGKVNHASAAARAHVSTPSMFTESPLEHVAAAAMRRGSARIS